MTTAAAAPARASLTVHVVYEHAADRVPFGSAYARLLRPLGHPALRGRVRATFGTDYDGRPVDVVVVDRLWCPDLSPAKARRLVADAHRAGAAVVHALDDSFPDLFAERPDWAAPDRVAAFETLLALADGVLVTTEPLAERYRTANPNVAVVPNALDERLVAAGRWRRVARDLRAGVRRAVRRGPAPVIVGYMGTYTHDDDLAMIAPALRAAHERLGDRLRLEIVGSVAEAATFGLLGDVPLAVVRPTTDEAHYPAFVPWFVGRFRWDIGLAPLRLTHFTRGKSDIKYLDYAAAGVVGVYSRHPAYAGTVRHGQTGWLAADEPAAWCEALEGLAADGGARRRMARAARDDLFARRTLARTVWRWPEALARLIGR